MTHTNSAIREINAHIRSINAESTETAKIALSPAQKYDNDRGLSSKSDYRMMYKTQADEELWNYTAQMIGVGSLRYHKESAPQKKKDSSETTKCFVKKPYATLHESYVKSTPRHPEAEKKLINRMKFEDISGVKPNDKLYGFKESVYPIKIVAFEYRKPYIIITAIKADDEHERITYTRQSDETSEFYFTFDVTTIITKKGQPMENPQLAMLRRWMFNKIVNSKDMTFSKALSQLLGRIAYISMDSTVIKDGKAVPNPDFIGYPTYDYTDRFDEESQKTCDHKGSFENLRLRKYRYSMNKSLVAND